MERERVREKEPAQEILYDDNFRRLARALDILKRNKRLIKGDQLPWEQGRQGLLRWYLHPLLKDTAAELAGAQWMRTFYHDIKKHSGRHTHQGGLGLFVVDGVGYSVVDGVKYDYESGDLIILPVKRGGCEHQHFNAIPGKSTILLSLIPQDMMQMAGVMLVQNEAHPDWKGEKVPEGYTQPDEYPGRKGLPGGLKPIPFKPRPSLTLWEQLFQMANEQKEELLKAKMAIKFKETPWEVNPQGRMKWYLHPRMKPKPTNALLCYIQEIPPGSRSGKVFGQGGWVFFVWRGRQGFTMVNDEKLEWGIRDMVVLPPTAYGLTYQHFNTDPKEPVLLLAYAPNYTEALGVELGVGLEMIETAPEWKGGR